MIYLSCASLSCDGFGDNDFVKTFELLPTIGYKYVEFNCWHPSTLTPQKMVDLRNRCKRSGLLPSSIHGNSFGGENNDGITKDICHKLRMMEAAKELGCNMISATGSSRGSQGGIKSIITVLREIAPAAEEWGIKVSLENHVANNLENMDDYQMIFEKVDSPNIGICLDTGHFDAAAVHIDDLIDTFGLHINHIHLKENKGFGTKVFTKFGQGTTDNYHVIEKLIRIGYEGFLVVELSPEIDPENADKFNTNDLILPRTMFERYVSE